MNETIAFLTSIQELPRHDQYQRIGAFMAEQEKKKAEMYKKLEGAGNRVFQWRESAGKLEASLKVEQAARKKLEKELDEAANALVRAGYKYNPGTEIPWKPPVNERMAELRANLAHADEKIAELQSFIRDSKDEQSAELESVKKELGQTRLMISDTDKAHHKAVRERDKLANQVAELQEKLGQCLKIAPPIARCGEKIEDSFFGEGTVTELLLSPYREDGEWKECWVYYVEFLDGHRARLSHVNKPSIKSKVDEPAKEPDKDETPNYQREIECLKQCVEDWNKSYHAQGEVLKKAESDCRAANKKADLIASQAERFSREVCSCFAKHGLAAGPTALDRVIDERDEARKARDLAEAKSRWINGIEACQSIRELSTKLSTDILMSPMPTGEAMDYAAKMIQVFVSDQLSAAIPEIRALLKEVYPNSKDEEISLDEEWWGRLLELAGQPVAKSKKEQWVSETMAKPGVIGIANQKE